MKPSEALELITYTGEKWGAAAGVPAEPGLLAVRVRAWMDELGHLEAEDVHAALVTFDSEFPPNVAAIHLRVTELWDATMAVPGWDQFWPWVLEVASRSSLYLYNDAPEFVCPWPEFAGIVTLSMVLDWARDGLQSGDLHQIIQGHLRRSFDARVGRLRVGLSGTARDTPALQAWQARFVERQRALTAGDDTVTGGTES
jgi:hypothetical protein